MAVVGAAAAVAPSLVRCRRGLLVLLLAAAAAAACGTPVAAQAASSATASVQTLSSQTSPGPRGPPQSPYTRRAAAGVVAAGTDAQRRTSGTETIVTPLPQRSHVRSGTIARGRGGGDIVFPDSQYKPRVGPNPPNCAHDGSTYCEETIDGYPITHLNSVLPNFIGLQEFFGNDTLPDPIGDRIGGETTLCRSQEKMIFPKMGQNAAGEWLFIVNLDSNYQQGIRVELCQGSDQQCLFASSFPNGAGGTCKQKYIFRRLVAVGSEGEPQPDSFRMPSCCVCFIDNAVANRAMFGVNVPRTSKRRKRRHYAAH